MIEDLPPAETAGRRQEHKWRTERALQEAALELFAANGYDTTTTDEIAERAGVSPRTFFRYFPTKECVLFVGGLEWFRSFTECFLAQPRWLTDVEAVRQTLLALAPQLAAIRRPLLLYEQAVASSPKLRGGVHDRQQQDIATVADAIAERSGIDEADARSFVLATVSLVVYRRSITLWLGGPASVEPTAIVADQLALLDEVITLGG